MGDCTIKGHNETRNEAGIFGAENWTCLHEISGDSLNLNKRVNAATTKFMGYRYMQKYDRKKLKLKGRGTSFVTTTVTRHVGITNFVLNIF